MYVVMVYDVNVERVSKVLQIGRKYLTWVQNSVLEGELTWAQLERLKREVRRVIDRSQDSVLFYLIRSPRWLERHQIGVVKGAPDWVV